MSSSDEDMLVALMYLRHKKRQKKRIWAHPYYSLHINHSSFILSRELDQDPGKFHGFYRMSIETFQDLVELMKPSIKRLDTNYRKAVSVEERLLITIRYMATGESFRAMTYHFMRGLTTISTIVSNTTENIWTVLHPEYLGSPTQEKWIQISNRFYELWNIPNCLGAIDVLMACVDADGLFTTIDVGEVGRNSDGAVFRTSNLGRALNLGVLQLPPSKPLPSSNDENDFPFYFVADEAFPLTKYIMRPYPKRSLDNKKRVFNYRLSRGRKSVECAFGMLVSKFRLFEGPICCKEETINFIIKAACVLHNFIRIKQGIFTHPKQFEIQQENHQISNIQVQQNRVQQVIRPLSEAQQNREKLCNYFMSPAGFIPYQWNTII